MCGNSLALLSPEMFLHCLIDALIAAGYTATSARANQISTHPLIRRLGPDRYRVIGGSPS